MDASHSAGGLQSWASGILFRACNGLFTSEKVVANDYLSSGFQVESGIWQPKRASTSACRHRGDPCFSRLPSIWASEEEVTIQLILSPQPGSSTSLLPVLAELAASTGCTSRASSMVSTATAFNPFTRGEYLHPCGLPTGGEQLTMLVGQANHSLIELTGGHTICLGRF